MPPQHSPTTEQNPNRQICILVVEDEVLVRMSVADALRDGGYRVIEAKTADEALAVLSADTTIDIVFSDIQMPGRMDGFALAQWLHRERPEIRVLLTSGVVKAGDVANDLRGGEAALLPKPYDHSEMLQRIKQLVART
jgi:CheY-like chemotaxis protein